MTLRRIAQRALIGIASWCKRTGNAGYDFFWEIQYNISTPQMRREDMEYMDSVIHDMMIDEDIYWMGEGSEQISQP